LLLAKRRPADLAERVASSKEPAAEYLQLAARLNAELVDFDDVDRSRHPVVRLFRRLGPKWGLAAIGALRRRSVDDIYATGEDVGLPLAMMLRALRSRGQLTMVSHNADTPKRRKLLRAVGHDVFRYVICLSTTQREILIDQVGFPGDKVRRLSNWLDPDFFRPDGSAEEEFVLSVGMQDRDYELLQAVALSLPHRRFHVVASGWSPHAGYAPASGIQQGSNIVLERNASSERLRELYAKARFVVAPLKPVSYAAGVTSILEAMAMRKAVIATDSPGIRDYVLPGKSASVVPPGDASALAAAIEELWNDGELIESMAKHNRRWIETDLNTRTYVNDVAHLLKRGPDLPLVIQEVATSNELQLLAEEWQDLFDRVPNALPFATHEWTAAWWTHLRRDSRRVRDSLRVFVVRTTAGEAIAIAPCLVTELRVFGLPLMRRLHPIGADKNLTEIRGMLVAPEREASAVAALSRHVGTEHGVDSVRWSGLRRTGDALANLGRQRGTEIDRKISAYLLPISGTWEEFRRSRPRNLRESLRKCYNSLARDGHQWRFRAIESHAEVLSSLDRFYALHAGRAGLKSSVPHPDYFASAEARRFLTDVMDRFARRGIARVFQLEIEGEVVAMRLGFQFGGSLYLYYSGFDASWSRYSVMTTVVAETIRHALEHGVTIVNLSTGADESKLRWRPDEVAYADAVIVARRLRARIAHRFFMAAKTWSERRNAMHEASTT
jgi:glycosyltransferase involved in cell wall biosynthesis/CelD/BcsL family acetyltransferase involved in cellulose biosynthesis